MSYTFSPCDVRDKEYGGQNKTRDARYGFFSSDTDKITDHFTC